MARSDPAMRDAYEINSIAPNGGIEFFCRRSVSSLRTKKEEEHEINHNDVSVFSNPAARGQKVAVGLGKPFFR